LLLLRHDAEKEIYYSPEELLAMVLNHSRSLAEDYARKSECTLTIKCENSIIIISILNCLFDHNV